MAGESSPEVLHIPILFWFNRDPRSALATARPKTQEELDAEDAFYTATDSKRIATITSQSRLHEMFDLINKRERAIMVRCGAIQLPRSIFAQKRIEINDRIKALSVTKYYQKTFSMSEDTVRNNYNLYDIDVDIDKFNEVEFNNIWKLWNTSGPVSRRQFNNVYEVISHNNTGDLIYTLPYPPRVLLEMIKLGPDTSDEAKYINAMCVWFDIKRRMLGLVSTTENKCKAAMSDKFDIHWSVITPIMDKI
jgi:hypothetical protein